MKKPAFIERNLTRVLLAEAQRLPVVTVTGPRQSGKTTLCKHMFPDKPLVSLEPIDNREYAQTDPRGFLDQYRDGAIFDEIQRTPDLLTYLQAEVDAHPEPGRYILTGSQNLGLTESVSQSLAGRTAILYLLPPSLDELQRFENAPGDLWNTLVNGAYPRIYRENLNAPRWLTDYIATYIERDVRQVLRVTNLTTFQRFLALAAGRTAQEIHYTELGGDAGVSHSTAKEWLSLLETSFVCFEMPAWHRNLRKQQVRSRKLHFIDSGVLCTLLGIRTAEQLRSHPLRGAIFESWMVSEVLKARLHQGLARELFHFRESRGLEIDLVVARQDGVALVEAKSAATIHSSFFQPLRKLGKLLMDKGEWRASEKILIYGGNSAQHRSDVSALPWHQIHTVVWGTDDDSPELDDDDEPEPDPQERMARQIADSVIRHFQPGGRFHGRYDPPEVTSFVPVALDPWAWQVPVYPHGTASAHLLRIYPVGDAVGELPQAHWHNEARALHRLATSMHPMLPKLWEAGRLQDQEHPALGYLVLDDTGEPIQPAHPLLGIWRQRPEYAFHRFVTLVEAVALLHDNGLIHRNLTPLATRAPWLPDAPVLLDGFHMSAFASVWLQRGLPVETHASLAGAAPFVRACLAPERLGVLYGTHKEPESFATDVFSLGMIGLGWFVLPYGEWPAEDIFVDGQYNADRHREVLDQLGQTLDSSGLPPPLRQLLRRMLAFELTERPTNAREIYEELCRMYGMILTYLDPQPPSGAIGLQIYYLQESIIRLYEDGRARTSVERPDHREYAQLMAQDLAGGILTWSPHGVVPWARERDPERIDKMKTARTVLIGEHYAYFCQYLHDGRTEEEPRVLVIKFMLPARVARTLRQQERVRPLPPVTLQFFDPIATHRRNISADAPSWQPLVLSVQFEERHPSAAPLVQACRWLLATQRAKTIMSEYPFERDTDEEGGIYLRQLDEAEAFADDSEDSAFVRLRLGNRPRRPMGKLFEELHLRALEEDSEQAFTIRTARKQPSADKRHLKRRLDDRSIELQESAAVPERGFIRPDDTGERRVLGRQYTALEAVDKRHPYLAAQLAAPNAIELPPQGPRDLGHLDQDTRQLVDKVLSSWPLFMLQGPPGTGKTFIARQVVRAILALDPFARILVAAQSHHALDNLLEGVAVEIGNRDLIILRTSSPQSEHKVGTVGKAHSVSGAVGQILDRLSESAESPPGAALDDQLRTRWYLRARERGDVGIDLVQRLKRSASVVFSTCTAATPHALGLDIGQAFDWVIIEEAGRAWITELLMPMLHGTRWFLIGDHRQLHAFEEDRVRALLYRDVSEQITTEVTGVEPDRAWDKYLNHFAHLMGTDPMPFGFDPRGRLSVQRRMHPDIGSLVSEAFYDGTLTTHIDAERAHRISKPVCFAGTALVWLDTSGYGRAAAERRVERGGFINLCERALVSFVLRKIAGDIAPHDDHLPELAILSPYRAQVETLRRKIPNGMARVHTSDAFQGREAEIVLVSLVRNNDRKNPRVGLGFLDEEQRANVLLSRARRLLIIVGSLDHFAGFADTHWGSIVSYVRRDTRFVVDPKTALGFQWSQRRRSRR